MYELRIHRLKSQAGQNDTQMRGPIDAFQPALSVHIKIVPAAEPGMF
jgi:hypothetical protein